MTVAAEGFDRNAGAGARTLGTTRSRWLIAAGGLSAGLVASGLAGTSTKTFSLGAVWIGVAAAAVLVLATCRLAMASMRSALPAVVYRQQFRPVLRQTLGWAFAAFALWFLIVQPLLLKAGIDVPMFK